MRERLIELYYKTQQMRMMRQSVGECVDFLLANGAIVPPNELYSIVDKGTIYASVSKAMVDWLPLYVIKEPEKYGYYKTKEEAENALSKLQASYKQIRKEDEGK